MKALVDYEMIRLVEEEGELFDPKTFSREHCRGCFYDLRLAAARSYSGLKREFFEVSDDSPLIINPRETVSVITEERLNLRSGRFGALMFTTIGLLHSGVFKPATTVDPGFDKQLIITLVNWGNREVVVYPGASISKIWFFELTSRPDYVWEADAWWQSFPKDYPPPLLEATWNPVTITTDKMLEDVRDIHGPPFDVITARLLEHTTTIKKLQTELDKLIAELKRLETEPHKK